MSDAKLASPSPSPGKAVNGDRDTGCSVARPAPAHYRTLLSARSLKFYDGTYKWHGGLGYWDERGVYHEFNDGEDEGRPPTPGPVGVWLEEGDELAREWETFVEKGGDGGVGERDGGSGTVDVEGTWTWASIDPAEADSDADDTSREEDMHSMNEEDMQLASELGPDPEALRARLEDLLASSSPLSDCPSDLSEWDEAALIQTRVAGAFSPPYNPYQSPSPSRHNSQSDPVHALEPGLDDGEVDPEGGGGTQKGGNRCRGRSVDSGVESGVRKRCPVRGGRECADGGVCGTRRRRSERIFLKV